MPGRSAAAKSDVRGSVTATRKAAAQISADLRNGYMLDATMERHGALLDTRDRRWLQELVYGMLRTRSGLDAIIEASVTGDIARLDAAVLDLLRLGTYQLLYMDSVPAYAAIAQTVELGKAHGVGAGKLVNAVLRRVDRERTTLVLPQHADSLDAIADEFSHPRWLIARWSARFGSDGARQILAANNREAPLFVRAFGISVAELQQELMRSGVCAEVVPNVPGTLRLSGGPPITEITAFRRGVLFVQDPAATLVTEYAALPAGSHVADLCAAPGGKTLELARVAASVFASDRSPRRIGRMLANVARVQAENVHVFVGDALQPPLATVDAVLLDVPCTGTGTFRRHPDARWRMKVSDVAVMAAQQKELVRSAAALVRPGGLLIYSTCSLEEEENDAQVCAFLAEHAEWTLEPPPATVVSDEFMDSGFLRVLPHEHGFDGAFAARLRKAG